jgi:hypothetical protein
LRMRFAAWTKTLVKNSMAGKLPGARLSREIYLGYDRDVTEYSYFSITNKSFMWCLPLNR